jgi:hypothetical protein
MLLRAMMAQGSGAADATALAIYNKIVAWWDHSGTGGELLDSHTGGYNETVAGTYTAGSAAVASGLGTSIATNIASRFNAAHAAALDLNNDFSVMQWFKRASGASQPSFPKLIGKYTDVANGKATYLLFINESTKKMMFRFNSGGGYYDATGATTLADSTAYLAIGSKLTTGSELYLNNVLDGSQASGGAPDTASDELRNGASSSTNNDCLIGNFAPAALFSPALTSTERAYLWNGGNGVSYATLKAAAGH